MQTFTVGSFLSVFTHLDERTRFTELPPRGHCLTWQEWASSTCQNTGITPLQTGGIKGKMFQRTMGFDYRHDDISESTSNTAFSLTNQQRETKEGRKEGKKGRWGCPAVHSSECLPSPPPPLPPALYFFQKKLFSISCHDPN